jgi:hypothetical protein
MTVKGYARLARAAGALLGLASLLATCAPAVTVRGQAATQQPVRPADFSFLYSFGVGAKNVLNTHDSTFTADMVMDPSVTCHLTLTPAELDTVYWKMREIDFSRYPSNWVPPVRPGGRTWHVVPHNSWVLIVRAGGRTHEVHDAGDVGTDDPASVRLGSLFLLIERMVMRKDEYKALPRPRGGYR